MSRCRHIKAKISPQSPLSEVTDHLPSASANWRRAEPEEGLWITDCIFVMWEQLAGDWPFSRKVSGRFDSMWNEIIYSCPAKRTHMAIIRASKYKNVDPAEAKSALFPEQHSKLTTFTQSAWQVLPQKFEYQEKVGLFWQFNTKGESGNNYPTFPRRLAHRKEGVKLGLAI